MAFEFDGRDQPPFVDNQEIPAFGRAEVARQGEHSAVLMNLRSRESVGFDQINDEG